MPTCRDRISAGNFVNMEHVDHEVFALMSVVLLLLEQSHSHTNSSISFLLRRRKRRQLRLRFLQSVQCVYLFARARYRALRQPRQAWVFPRPQNWFELLLNDRTVDHWWKENFRVTRGTFEFICRLVGPALQRQDTRLRAAIPVEKRVAASLWRLASGECFRSCGLMLGLAKPTVVNCCHEFVQEICNFQNEFIQFPSTRAEIAKKIKDFSEISKIPNVVAAIDGSHVPIKKPITNHEDFFNRKHFYSYLVQGVVDSKGLFLSVATGFPGSLHDARMLRLSEFNRAADNEEILTEPTMDVQGTVIRPIVLGDSAYPLKSWLLPVIKNNNNLTREKKIFNKELSKARIVAEHAFGLMKGRWRVLQKRLDEDQARVPDTIIACCILHNICVMRGDEYDGDLFNDDTDDDDDDDADNAVARASARNTLQAIIDHVANQ